MRVAACGICGSDLHRYRHHSAAAGAPPGHELSGTIIDGGRGLADALYTVAPWLHCGTCDMCRAGRWQHCRTARLLGVHVPGAMAGSVDAPESAVYALDPSLSPLEGSMTEPIAVCTHAIHLARLQRGSRVLVLGAGTLGLTAALLARDVAGRVAVSARYLEQAAAAQAMGLEAIPDTEAVAWGADNEPDVVIETVGGSADTINEAMRAAGPGGRIVVVGLFSGEPGIDARALVHKELTITGSKVFGVGDHGPEFRAAADRLPRYKAELKVLQTHQFPLADIAEAFVTASDKHTGTVKVTLMADG